MIGAAIGLAGQIYGAVKGAQDNKRNDALLRSQNEENESFYNNNVNRDFLETNAAKGMTERLDKNLRDSNKVIDSNAAVTGGTAEASIAAKSKNQENYGNTMSQIAEKATDFQQRGEAIYRGQKNNLVNAEMKINSDKAANAANLTNNAAGLVSASADLSDFSAIGNKVPILGKAGLNPVNPVRGTQLGN